MFTVAVISAVVFVFTEAVAAIVVAVLIVVIILMIVVFLFRWFSEGGLRGSLLWDWDCYKIIFAT